MKKFYSRFYIAFTMLTRLPLPFAGKIGFEDSNLSGSAVFYPPVGLFYGFVLFAAAFLCRDLKAGADLTAFFLLAIPLILNRFLHLDGLCDVLDAFLSDKSTLERRSIMKDSRIGTFALGGGFLLLLFKFILLSNLSGSKALFPALLLMPVISRASVVPLAYSSTYPRSSGTGRHLIGRIFTGTLAAALSLTAFILVCVFWIFGLQLLIPFLAVILICSLWTVLFRWICYRKIGGVTGDCLGAQVETVEIVFLCVLLSVIR